MVGEFDWRRFSGGFWHPFGRYTGLSEAQILKWKRDETEGYGWTFWSFVYSPNAHVWLNLLGEVAGPVFVLCSQSQSRSIDPDPHRGTLRATSFQLPGSAQWEKMPKRDLMKVTNPLKRKGLALAFRVCRVIEVNPVVPDLEIQWYSKLKQQWQSTRLPPRGEFLIRRAPGAPPRSAV
jgi:hypothetical protein